jgi:2,5-diketo-D-gluconate reductase B
MASRIESRTIQGHRVPALGFGTFQLEGRDCYEGVRDALDIGYRHIDTAQMYGNEEQVGQAIRDSEVSREDVFLTTKIWIENLEPKRVRRTTEESLKKLRVDGVDLLLIHWPNDDVPLRETLAAMLDLRQEGKTRHVGVSNFTPRLLRQALELAPVLCDQVEYHPFLGQRPLLDVIRDHDLLLTAYSPLARGRVAGDPNLQEIGRTHGKSAAQVALRWLIQQPQVAAIPKASTAEHRRSNFDIFDFELSAEEMERIHGLARGQRMIDPGFAPAWES